MKLIINYDFIDAIRNVNEPYNTYKIIRNSKKDLGLKIPFWAVANYAIWQNIPDTMLWLCIQFYIDTFCKALEYKMTGIDPYEDKAYKRLQRLVLQFNDINLSTDIDLLLQSELYYKKHKVDLSDGKVPSLMEEKFIYVPTYKYDGDVDVTSVQQEHVVGSREYVLSLGSPKTVHQASFSQI